MSDLEVGVDVELACKNSLKKPELHKSWKSKRVNLQLLLCVTLMQGKQLAVCNGSHPELGPRPLDVLIAIFKFCICSWGASA